MNTKQLPEGLQLAVEIIESTLAGPNARSRARAAIRAEHQQRLTLQHHACDQAQRIADLETKCDTLKRLRDELVDERDKAHGKLLHLAQRVADLERAVVKRREISDGVEAELADECDTLQIVNKKVEAERDELRARLAEIEAQEPVAVIRTWHKSGEQHADMADWCDLVDALPDGEHKLYARPVPAIPDGWQPIETAPKDGTNVLVSAAGGVSDAAHFSGGHWVVAPGTDADGAERFVDGYLTHWMPIPAAPEAAR